jgi:murein DD-endopeptidase MepM/ murein hydrolase activator NlpD
MFLGLLTTFSVFAAAVPVLEIQPGSARPGDIVYVRIADEPLVGWLGQTALKFYPRKKGYGALAVLPLEAAPGSLPVRVRFETKTGTIEHQGTLDVRPADFPKRELTVAKKFTEAPPPAIRKQIEQDRAAIAKAFEKTSSKPLFEANFRWPRNAVVTAPFGDLRTFNGQRQSQHYGTDLDGQIGDPIFAANEGEVVLVRPCYASGNTVIIHHGLGLFTSYFHLNKFHVHQGQKVKAGTRIGDVGKTGRVTGPHLHWSVKLDGLYADPVSLLSLDVP